MSPTMPWKIATLLLMLALSLSTFVVNVSLERDMLFEFARMIQVLAFSLVVISIAFIKV